MALGKRRRIAITLTFIIILSFLTPLTTYRMFLESQETMRKTMRECSTLRLPKDSPLEQWRLSFENSELLRSAPLGAVLAPTYSALNKLQEPENCSTGSFLLYEYSSSLGFGAVVKHLTSAFYSAIRTNRTFVLDDSKQFYWAHGCNIGPRFECFFRPLSTCSPALIRQLVREKKLIYHKIPENPRLDRYGVPVILAADTKKPSVVKWPFPSSMNKNLFWSINSRGDATEVLRLLLPHGTIDANTELRYLQPERNAQRTLNVVLATYIVRLNEITANRTACALNRLLKRNNLNGNDSLRVIGVPVRRSDKCFGNKFDQTGEMRCVNASVALDYARRVAVANPTITHVLLTSEDDHAITSGVEKQATSGWFKLRVMRNYLDVPPGSGGSGIRKDKSMAELLQAMLITLHLQAFASFHVLTPRSTFHSLIAAVARAVPGKRDYFLFPLGEDRELQWSMASQLMR